MATNTEPAWYQQMMKSGYKYDPVYGPVPEEAIVAPDGPVTIRDPDTEPNGITLRSGSEAMIHCSKEGFWVRGVKVAQDDREAEVVYNAFKQWLTWAQLNDLR